MFSKLRVRRKGFPERAVLFRVSKLREDKCDLFILQSLSICGQFKSSERHVEIVKDSRDDKSNIASDVISKFGKFINVKCLSPVSFPIFRGSFPDASFRPGYVLELPFRTNTSRFDRPPNQNGIVVKAVLNTRSSWISSLISCRSSGNSKSPFGCCTAPISASKCGLKGVSC